MHKLFGVSRDDFESSRRRSWASGTKPCKGPTPCVKQHIPYVCQKKTLDVRRLIFSSVKPVESI